MQEDFFCESLVVVFTLLIGISASLKIFNNNSVINSTKTYDVDFSSRTGLLYSNSLR